MLHPHFLKNNLLELFSVSKLLIYVASVAEAVILLRIDCNRISVLEM